MKDEEIIKHILKIQEYEKSIRKGRFGQRPLAKLLRVGTATLNRILRGHIKICPRTKQLLMMAFQMYENDMLK